MYFVGIDLSWKKRPMKTAIVILTDLLKIFSCSLVTDDTEIIEAIKNLPECIVAIDAPLVVNNKYGKRKCDALIHRKYNIPSLPANLSWFNRVFNGARGVKLLKKLERIGFKLVDKSKNIHKKSVIEVYPFASWKLLLNQVPKYKKGKKEERKNAIEFMKKRLEDIGIFLPPRINDDILDAAISAYTAYFFYFYPDRCKVVGNLKDGFIVLPFF